MRRRTAWIMGLGLLACNVSLVAAPADGDGGLDGGSIDRATCPNVAPAANSPCTLPEGTSCGFGTCALRLARCSQGKWTFGANAPPRTACPINPPTAGDACPKCWPGGTCTYQPQNCQPDSDAAAPNVAVASCIDNPSAPIGIGAMWTLSFLPCQDAGADVQGDAGLDAD